MGDETLIDILQEEGGQPIFNNAVLRRLHALDEHNLVTDSRLTDIESYQAPIREISIQVRKFVIYITALALIGLVLSEVSGISNLSTLDIIK